ncbi:MAG: hypothetical protein J7L78_03415, partial [Dehalococcoidales bacterium]|nr:hypothetical protein [Dehalococcoidales bacterium]
MPRFVLGKDSLEWALNMSHDYRVRRGFALHDKVSPDEIVAFGGSPFFVAIDANGNVFDSTGATLGTITKAARWVDLTPVTVQKWNNTTNTWDVVQAYVVHTDADNYIIDTTASTVVQSIALSQPTAPTLASGGAGNIPAGTYYYVITEVDEHGNESVASASTSITLTSSSQVAITFPASVNANAVQWRVYRSERSPRIVGREQYRLVTQQPIATTSTTDNVAPPDLTILLDSARIALPQSVRFSVISNGILVSSGNSSEPSTVYFSEISVNKDGLGYAGYPSVGSVKTTVKVPDGSTITALAAVGNATIVFTDRNVWALYNLPWDANSYMRKICDEYGCYDFRCVTAFDDRVFFMSYNRRHML